MLLIWTFLGLLNPPEPPKCLEHSFSLSRAPFLFLSFSPLSLSLSLFLSLYLAGAFPFALSLTKPESERTGPGARNIGAPLPFLLIDVPDGGARGREEYCLNNEAFAPVPPLLQNQAVSALCLPSSLGCSLS